MKKYYPLVIVLLVAFQSQSYGFSTSDCIRQTPKNQARLAVPVISGNFSICLPGPNTTQLTASELPAAINPWISSNTAVATVNNTGLVTAVSFGATTITYTDNLGVNASVNVYVSTFPTITSPSGSYTTCEGGTLQLNGSVFPNAVTPWASSNPAIATVDNTGLVTGVSGGTCSIIYQNIGGCSVAKTITIDPLLIPTITCGASTENQITINWTPVPGATTYTTVYTVNGGAFVLGGFGVLTTFTKTGLSAGDTVSFYVTPSGPVGSCFSSGTVTCSTSTNCDETNTPAQPVVTLLQPTCSVSTGSIAIAAVAGNTYSFDGGPYTTTLLYSGLLAGSIHSVTAKNAAGCISSVTSVTIGNQPSNPAATLTLTSPIGSTAQSTCLFTAITPVVFTVGGGATGASLISGSVPSGFTGTFNQSLGIFTLSGIPTELGTFSYLVATTGGCGTATQSGTITVYPTATITLASSPSSANQVVCFNSPISPTSYTIGNGALSATVSAGSLPAGLNAIFSAGSLIISGTSLQSGTFPYTVMTTGGCGTASLSGVIVVNPLLDYLSCDASQTTSPNSVYFDWQPIPGVTSYVYSYSINGGPYIYGTTSVSHYEVLGVLPGQDVFFTVSETTTVCSSSITTTCTNLSNEVFQDEAFRYFPNPVSNLLNLTNANPINSVVIINSLGQSVLNKSYNANSIQIDLSSLAPGIYLVKLSSDYNTKTIKIVKE
ncbi:Ig-like domain-containing protein [Flavobacterium sp.]|uniref:Ig-like domain-containing protein n=1 Tax=Flavobacterium sp. TaxID=239 RepID=UPI002617138A|nr:Ig-like domain-containing protein [Flavobacterium sp.]